jgi:hypothetical protein
MLAVGTSVGFEEATATVRPLAGVSRSPLVNGMTAV